MEQPSLFPIAATLQRIRPDRNEWRYYRLSLEPDLFGGTTLVRHWGRIGTAGIRLLKLFTDEGAAANELAALIRYRCKRGYVLLD
ncbi:WGR domain-containing protein [Gluconacetobacter diazotrophicus]|uniref:WGR domain-containing protein n=1 Tax=Gluconacetobacter diazotrophicus TaxID=33996 RepID=A0A7W4NLB3_GLUDI|nr:WGR domain-containing protein [Gluconacetobacter diazotrophicus]MBB2157363.1 WGR domain-containing protein [Gluconacetobacter diazotrophicus]